MHKFKILFTLLFVIGEASFANALDTASLIQNKCPEDQIIHQNLRAGAYNGRYHPYTRAVVSEAHLLQKHLNRLGFSSGAEDGKLGPISTAAIKRMQRYLGTKADGIVGPKTRAMLNNSCEKKSLIPCGVDAPGCAMSSAYIDTLPADSIRENSAVFKSRITMGNSQEAGIYFLWGADRGMVTNASRKKDYAKIKSFGNRLEKLFVGRVFHGGSFSKKFNDLVSGQKYYYTACISDKNNYVNRTISCGKVLSFTSLSPETEKDDKKFIPKIKTNDLIESFISAKRVVLWGSFLKATH